MVYVYFLVFNLFLQPCDGLVLPLNHLHCFVNFLLCHGFCLFALLDLAFQFVDQLLGSLLLLLHLALKIIHFFMAFDVLLLHLLLGLPVLPPLLQILVVVCLRCPLLLFDFKLVSLYLSGLLLNLLL